MSTESNGVRFLGIVGSPRRGGNTDTLVDEILAGAEETGAVTEKVFLNDLQINPCRACDACRKTGACVQQDDMSMVLEKMQHSQVWVLGTPIYWWGPTSQFKAFLDRWYGVNQVMFQGRKAILVIPLGGGSESYARHTVGMLTDVLSYLGIQHGATILALGSNDRSIVKERPHILEAARDAGRMAAHQ